VEVRGYRVHAVRQRGRRSGPKDSMNRVTTEPSQSSSDVSIGLGAKWLHRNMKVLSNIPAETGQQACAAGIGMRVFAD